MGGRTKNRLEGQKRGVGAVRARALPVFSQCGRVRDFTTSRARTPFPGEEEHSMEVRRPPHTQNPPHPS